MKRNLLIGTSLVAAFATTSLDARAFSAMSEASFKENTEVANTLVVAEKAFAAEFDTKAVALKAETGSTLLVSTLNSEAGRAVVAKILKATADDAKDADALNAAFGKQTEAQKKATVAEIAKALATNAELRKIVEPFRAKVVEANASEAAAKAAKVNEKKAAADKAAAKAAELKSATAEAAAKVTTVTGELADLEAKLKADPENAELKTAVEAKTTELKQAQKAADEVNAKLLSAQAAAEKTAADLETAQQDAAAKAAEAVKKDKEAKEAAAKAASTLSELQKKLDDALKASSDRAHEISALTAAAKVINADKVLEAKWDEVEAMKAASEQAVTALEEKLKAIPADSEEEAREELTKALRKAKQKAEIINLLMQFVDLSSAKVEGVKDKTSEATAEYLNNSAQIVRSFLAAALVAKESLDSGLLPLEKDGHKLDATDYLSLFMEKDEDILKAVNLIATDFKGFDEVKALIDTDLTSEENRKALAAVHESVSALVGALQTLLLNAKIAEANISELTAFGKTHNIPQVKKLLEALEKVTIKANVATEVVDLVAKLIQVQKYYPSLVAKSEALEKSIAAENEAYRKLSADAVTDQVATDHQALITKLNEQKTEVAAEIKKLEESLQPQEGAKHSLRSYEEAEVQNLTAETINALKTAVAVYTTFLNEPKVEDIEFVSADVIEGIFGRKAVEASEDHEAVIAVSGADGFAAFKARTALKLVDVRKDFEAYRADVDKQIEGMKAKEYEAQLAVGKANKAFEDALAATPELKTAFENIYDKRRALQDAEKYLEALQSEVNALEAKTDRADEETAQLKDLQKEISAVTERKTALNTAIADGTPAVKTLLDLLDVVHGLDAQFQTLRVENQKTQDTLWGDLGMLHQLVNAVDTGRNARAADLYRKNYELTDAINAAVHVILSPAPKLPTPAASEHGDEEEGDAVYSSSADSSPAATPLRARPVTGEGDASRHSSAASTPRASATHPIRGTFSDVGGSHMTADSATVNLGGHTHHPSADEAGHAHIVSDTLDAGTFGPAVEHATPLRASATDEGDASRHSSATSTPRAPVTTSGVRSHSEGNAVHTVLTPAAATTDTDDMSPARRAILMSTAMGEEADANKAAAEALLDD